MKKIFYISVLCLLASTFTFAQTNLLKNPGFETVNTDGTPADWTNLASSTQTIETVTNIVNAGSNSLKVTTSGYSGQIVIQYVPVTPGKTYDLSVWCNLQSYTGTTAGRTFMGLSYSYADADGNNLNSGGQITGDVSGGSVIGNARIAAMTSPINIWQQMTLTTSEVVPSTAAYITIILSSGRITGYYDNVSVTEVGAVSKQDQTITGLSDITKKVGDAAFDLSATTTSGLDVIYSSSNTAVATISGKTVTIVGVGSTTITASQAGNSSYNPATNVTATLTVSTVAGIDKVLVKLPIRQQGDNLIVTTETGSSIDVYNALGLRLQSEIAKSAETTLSGLPKGQVLIVHSGNAVAKVIL